MIRMDELRKRYPGQTVRLVQTKKGFVIRREIIAKQRFGKRLLQVKAVRRLLAVYPAEIS
jgi:hypothetical protein